MFMFGLVMIFQGLVSNWSGLMATRFFLGVFETGMFPGCKYLQPQSKPFGSNADDNRQASI
jgi:hypothetical protein